LGWHYRTGDFLLAYALVIMEEQLHLRKSKPVIVAAGIIWALIAYVYSQHGDIHTAEIIVKHNLLEFAELFFFLLAAMTYINTMDERGIFNALRSWLITQGYSLRTVFWLTGLIAFFLSPIADNLTTALLMSTVVMAVGRDNHKFVTLACINIVVSANAGGAFSPFGDITTLMVWQKGLVEFGQFLVLFLPSLISWLIPALLLSFFVPNAQPAPLKETIRLRHGTWIVVALFILTITMAVSFHQFLHMPPVVGMMTGLGLLKLFGYYLKRRPQPLAAGRPDGHASNARQAGGRDSDDGWHYNIFRSVERAEWDTLMFFYGVILCVGGLSTLGYLTRVSQFMYGDLGPTTANILVGILSAIVDNIPVMFAVLTMEPEMRLDQWLLVTLTAGIGGSLLSIGSAAGVARSWARHGAFTPSSATSNGVGLSLWATPPGYGHIYCSTVRTKWSVTKPTKSIQ
jgi:Na+/H+ antiporter NhaD/arsenite permease-like protein